MSLQDGITLFSGDNAGVELIDASDFFDQNTYCCIDIEQIENYSTPYAIHFWAIDDRDEIHKNRRSLDLWHGWVSLTNYSHLLNSLDQITFNEYDDVNRDDIAFTNCLSHGAFCPVCDDQIEYRTDVVSICHAKGPLYVHKTCFPEFQKVLHSVYEKYKPEFTALVI